MPGLLDPAGEVEQPHGGVRGLHAAEVGQESSGVSRQSSSAVRHSETGGVMERGETTEPDGGVVMVALVVLTSIAFATGVLVGYGAALVLR